MLIDDDDDGQLAAGRRGELDDDGGVFFVRTKMMRRWLFWNAKAGAITAGNHGRRRPKKLQQILFKKNNYCTRTPQQNTFSTNSNYSSKSWRNFNNRTKLKKQNSKCFSSNKFTNRFLFNEEII